MGCLEDEDSCQSGETYQFGFRQALEVMRAPVAIWENVRGALQYKKDVNGQKMRPEVKTVLEDMEKQGKSFAYKLVDTAKFLLPQRRNRVYGVASQDSTTSEAFQVEYEDVLSLFESFARWPLDEFLSGPQPDTAMVLTKRFKDMVQSLKKEAVGVVDPDLFVDMSTSAARPPEKAFRMSTCLRPTHKVYSVSRQPLHILFYI